MSRGRALSNIILINHFIGTAQNLQMKRTPSFATLFNVAHLIPTVSDIQQKSVGERSPYSRRNWRPLMSLISLFTLIQVACFQGCAIPGIVRMARRKSSHDLSMWREILILVGASFQLGAMFLAGVKWQIYASPITSIVSIGTFLCVILYYRRV
jgi:hypothetical protein